MCENCLYFNEKKSIKMGFCKLLVRLVKYNDSCNDIKTNRNNTYSKIIIKNGEKIFID